ncbi:hypothetical protein H0H92_001187 [Tricholoma furcatifolium]|nr:hypothetical protein H0H92_001187 [Tricholoma furcatifolium]
MPLTLSDSNGTEVLDHPSTAMLTNFDNGGDHSRLLLSHNVSTSTTLDQALDDTQSSSPALESQMIVAAQQHVKESGGLPASYVIDDITNSGIVVASGGFANVSRGYHWGNVVCVKSKQDTLNEAVLCGHLSHPNIVPFLGVCFKGITPLLVYQWMKHGDLPSYLMENPLASRVCLLHDAAQGVEYLHERSIVHGDIKGANIVVNDSGRALICDFGLASILPSSGGTVMYKAPEIFKQESFNTKETDIYAFGCLAYEAFTGKPPFAKFTAHLIISKVMHGHRPKRPPNSSSSWNAWGLTEHIWMLIQRCWEETAARRPMIDAVIHRLEQALPEDI